MFCEFLLLLFLSISSASVIPPSSLQILCCFSMVLSSVMGLNLKVLFFLKNSMKNNVPKLGVKF